MIITSLCSALEKTLERKHNEMLTIILSICPWSCILLSLLGCTGLYFYSDGLNLSKLYLNDNSKICHKFVVGSLAAIRLHSKQGSILIPA